MEYCNVNTSGVEQYKKENQELCDFFLENYFYKYFRHGGEVDEINRNLELIISPKCNLGCKYCYVHRYRDKIFDDNCFDEENTIKNIHLIMQWLDKNDFNPPVEIFSGELLAQEVGYQVLNIICDYQEKREPERRIPSIVIPTNFTFICSEEATARVEAIRKRLDDLGIAFGLSASFDGKYMEENRPYLHDLDVDLGGGKRDDDYYERAFAYASGHCIGFHPMVYSKNIDAWPKNFDWFQEMMEKYNVPWENIYLLHVRNQEWTDKEIESLGKFMEHIYAFAWEKVGRDPEMLVNWLIRGGNGFNMLSQPYGCISRGLGCGIQAQMTIRVSDLMSYPCHRTGYRDFYTGQLVPDEDKVLRFECKNVELLMATFGVHQQAMPHCAQCPINKICTGTCIGAQYESNRNLFAPIPSVCASIYHMCIVNMKCLKKYGAWDIMKNCINQDKVEQFKYLEEKINV